MVFQIFLKPDFEPLPLIDDILLYQLTRICDSDDIQATGELPPPQPSGLFFYVLRSPGSDKVCYLFLELSWHFCPPDCVVTIAYLDIKMVD